MGVERHSSYAYAGQVNGPSNQGGLTADLPAHSSPDTVDTLSVDLSESRGSLMSVSAGDAANLVTLCWVGGEFIAYETAILTSAYHYNLTTLYRGCYGSTITDHPASSLFARLDTLIGRFPIPNTLVGKTIYLKFLSFNLVGGGLQNLASASPFTYSVSGAGSNPLDNPVINSLAAGNPADWGTIGASVVATADFGILASPAAITINLGTVP
jgi:hypothetical protein